jgi:hypothetical protein
MAPNSCRDAKQVDDWYGTGADMDERCRALLNSPEWQRANPLTYEGLVKRLEMIEKVGLLRMRVIAASKIGELGLIPRSNEDHQVDALEVVKRCGKDAINNKPKTLIAFFPHRWKRPKFCETLEKDVAWGSPERQAAEAAGYPVGDPDGAG